MTFGNIILEDLLEWAWMWQPERLLNYQDSVHVKLIPEGDTSPTPSPTSTSTGKATAAQIKSTRETLPKRTK